MRPSPLCRNECQSRRWMLVAPVALCLRRLIFLVRSASPSLSGTNCPTRLTGDPCRDDNCRRQDGASGNLLRFRVQLDQARSCFHSTERPAFAVPRSAASACPPDRRLHDRAWFSGVGCNAYNHSLCRTCTFDNMSKSHGLCPAIWCAPLCRELLARHPTASPRWYAGPVSVPSRSFF